MPLLMLNTSKPIKLFSNRFTKGTIIKKPKFHRYKLLKTLMDLWPLLLEIRFELIT